MFYILDRSSILSRSIPGSTVYIDDNTGLVVIEDENCNANAILNLAEGMIVLREDYGDDEDEEDEGECPGCPDCEGPEDDDDEDVVHD